jgi:hypothetical protein
MFFRPCEMSDDDSTDMLHARRQRGHLHRFRKVRSNTADTAEVLVEQALALLFGRADASSGDDYWFSVSTMREDWDATPEDWQADEVSDAVPSR